MTIIVILLIVIAYLILTGNSAREKTHKQILEKLDEQTQNEKKQAEELRFRLGQKNDDGEDDISVQLDKQYYSFTSQLDEMFWQYTYQYKFDENKNVLIKLIYHEVFPFWVVQDGIIIEDAFVKAFGQDRGNYHREDLKRQIAWHNCEAQGVRSLLLSLHPEVISHSDLRQQIRQELETFKGQCQKLHEHVAQIGARLEEENSYICLKLTDDSRADEQKLVDLCKQFNLNFHAFISQKAHIKELEESLSRIPPKPLYDD